MATLEPAGEAYLDMVTSSGLSAKPGDRLVLSDVKIERNRIVFDLNGGPDPKHRFLRHIQIGAGPDVMGPVVQDDGQAPVGSRLALTFAVHVPELTGAEVKALLAPLISFDLKTPIQAYTDTLPTKLKEAIVNHQVWVGMSTEMVLFAKGQPEGKSREMEGQMPFEEWIYGKPPKDVEFVRVNGNRVIRVEDCQDRRDSSCLHDGFGGGPDAHRRHADRSHGHPWNAHCRSWRCAARSRDAVRGSAAQPAQTRGDGAHGVSPTSDEDPSGRRGVMKPVQFPKQKPASQPGANPDEQSDSPQPAGQTPQTGQTRRRPRIRSPRPRMHRSQAKPSYWLLGRREPVRRISAIALMRDGPDVNWSVASPAPSRQFLCDERRQMTAPLKPSARPPHRRRPVAGDPVRGCVQRQPKKEKHPTNGQDCKNR